MNQARHFVLPRARALYTSHGAAISVVIVILVTMNRVQSLPRSTQQSAYGIRRLTMAAAPSSSSFAVYGRVRHRAALALVMGHTIAPSGLPHGIDVQICTRTSDRYNIATMDPSRYRALAVSRGYVYNVYYSPASGGKPTLLFMHGFPSSTYDWRRQIPHFAAAGFGIVAPDMLGAGGSSKPMDSKAFRLGALAKDTIDILDALGLGKVIGISTDWGGVFLSRLSMLYQERFHGLAWLGIGFRPADVRPLDLERDCDMYAYWDFFLRPKAADTIRKNIDSFMQLAYPKDPDSWVTWMLTPGKTAECLESNIQLGRSEWLSEEEYARLRQDLLKSGVASALLWYANEVEGNDREENFQIPTDAYTIRVPALFVGASKDPLLREAAGLAQMRKYATALRTASVDAGHYLHLERADEVNGVLEEWIGTIKL